MAYRTILTRARIGFIIPSSNRMVEPQAAKFMPEGVQPHFTRIGMTNRHKAPLDQLLPRILDAAELLADSQCDVTVLQCTGTSMSGGVDKEAHVIREIERVTGKPALSAASSLTTAFRTLGAKKLVFISESKQDDHDKKKDFVLEAGYDVLADKAVALSGTDEYCIMPPELWFDTAMSLRRDDADAYFISCANIRSIDAIEALEKELGKPVVTSNQAAFWCSLRMAGIQDVVPGLGQLMQHDVLRTAAAAE